MPEMGRPPDSCFLQQDAPAPPPSRRAPYEYVLGGDERIPEATVVDIRTLGSRKSSKERQLVVDAALATRDQDNERFLKLLRARMDRVGLENPKVEVRFEKLSLEADVFVGSRALPSIPNSIRNFIEAGLQAVGLMHSHKRRFDILKDVSGTLKPGRLTLLLGPPGSGKSSLLKALAGKMTQAEGVRSSGNITYNGETFDAFVPQRTACYVDQTDNAIAELTVAETFDFAGRCQSVGHRAEMFEELLRREEAAGIEPDAEVTAFIHGSNLVGKRHNVVTEYTLRLLGLEICKDTIVGNQLVRGISGGQRKRVTLGEMMCGPKTVHFLDEISTGLDSSTTHLLIQCLANFCHLQDATVLISLLQPSPETFGLFDDIMLLSEGHLVYHGEKEGIMPFFNSLGFEKPERKGIADFLQEVTSKKDQQQYFTDKTCPYEFVPVRQFADAFQKCAIGRDSAAHLATPHAAAKIDGPDPLIRTRYALSGWQAYKACQRREWTLMKRHWFLYIFRTFQVAVVSTCLATLFLRTTLQQNTVEDGEQLLSLQFFAIIHMMFNGYSEMSIITATLGGFYKQRDNNFYQAWCSQLPTALLRIPYSLVEGAVLTGIVYYTAGLAPSVGRFFIFFVYMVLVHQMAVAVFRMVGAVGRSLVAATTFGNLLLMVFVVLGGYALSKPDVRPWSIWLWWISPITYVQEGMSISEFSAARWQKPDPAGGGLLGDAVLQSRGLFTQTFYVWLGVIVLIGYVLLFNALLLLAMTYLDPLGETGALLPEEALIEREVNRSGAHPAISADKQDSKRNIMANGSQRSLATAGRAETVDIELGLPPRKEAASNRSLTDSMRHIKGVPLGEKGMVLPFQPMHLTFSNICYYVDFPKEMDQSCGVRPDGASRPMLQLLRNVSGAFRPKVLTALVGVSGAGKTTLMDVLAGRKTGGIITGDIRLDGHPKQQATFARISGYVEQADIHSPQVTVGESLLFSARLRLQDVDAETASQFVEEVMELVELDPLRNALVGLPGRSGLSVEARKRLTIAVELVANPSVVFMDEPTSGLDARAAQIVMRCVRNVVNTSRTCVCTIHQPSIDIFEAFDDLLLLKHGGQVTYMGPLGNHSTTLVDYFEAIENVPRLTPGLNPASWMLEISTIGREEEIGVDFAEVFLASDLFRQNQELIQQLSIPKEGSRALSFSTEYPTSLMRQTDLLFRKMLTTYWRSPQYNTVRYVFSICLGFIVGSVYWRLGSRRDTQADVENVLAAVFVAQIFIGTSNASTVQPVVAVERTVFYRERAAGLYAVLPYAIAQGAVELPFVLVQAVIFTCIAYFMIYFEISAAKFFWYLLFQFLTLIVFTQYGVMAVSLSPNLQMAAVVSSAFFSIWFLMCGFIRPQPQIRDWWIWYYWLDPVSYTLYGVVGSQLGDVYATMVADDGQLLPVNQFIRQDFGWSHDFIGYCALIMVGFWVVFWAASGVALKKLNWQKR